MSVKDRDAEAIHRRRTAHEPPRNEQQLLRKARESGLFPKQTIGKLQRLLALKEASEEVLAQDDLRRMRLEKEKRHNAFLELERNRSNAESLRLLGLRVPNIDARVQELKSQLSTRTSWAQRGKNCPRTRTEASNTLQSQCTNAS